MRVDEFGTAQHPPYWRHSRMRCYGPLNDLLPERVRHRSFLCRFRGKPTLLALVESQGIPHPEVDLLLVDGEPAPWGQHLRGGERLAVFPSFGNLDIGKLGLIPKAEWRGGFILDVHLGTLARRLRLLGFDCVYRNDFADNDLIDQALAEQRLILTRDLGLLKQGRVRLGYFVRATDPNLQTREVICRLALAGMLRPFTRCLRCNGDLQPVAIRLIAERVPSRVRESYPRFFRCRCCDQIYWEGTHFARLSALVERLRSRRH